MSLTITIPYRSTPSHVACNYFAVHNPLVVRVQRKDYVVDSTTDNGAGKVKVIVGFTEDVRIGDFIYVNSQHVVGTYPSLVEYLGGGSEIEIDLDYVADSAGGYANMTTARENYYIRTRVLKYNAGMTATTLHISRPDFPDTSGLAKVDVSRNFRTLVSSVNDFNYRTTPYINQIDNKASWKGAITCQEFWDGSSTSASSPQDLYLVNGAMQLQSEGGVCMLPYFSDAAGIPELSGKFLSDMTRPRRWDSLPFDLSFIFTAPMHDFGQVHRYEQVYAAGAIDVTNDDNLEMGNYRWVNRMLMKGSYDSDQTHADVFLGNPTAPDGYYDPDYIDDDYFAGGIPMRFTEKITVNLSHCLPKNPVYLAWVNKKGGWNYFCFGVKQLAGRKTSTDGEIAHFMEDLENSYRTHSFLNKISEPYMLLIAEQLDRYDMEGMESLADSPEVLMLMNPTTWTTDTEGPIWQTVRLDVGDYRMRDTKKTFNKAQFKIRLPELFIQNQ